MIELGIQPNPEHPELLELLAAGVTPEAIVTTGKELAQRQGRPPRFAYVLATVRGRIEEAKPINGSVAPAAADYGESDLPAMLGGAR